MKLYLLFNTNKQFIGFSPSNPPSQNILVKEIEMEPGTNLGMYGWVGDFDTGSLQMTSDIPAKVSQMDLEEQFLSRLFRKYPLEKMLVTILAQMAVVMRQDYIKDHHINDNCRDMLEFFHKNYGKMLRDMENYKNSPHHEYLDGDMINRDTKLRFEVQTPPE